MQDDLSNFLIKVMYCTIAALIVLAFIAAAQNSLTCAVVPLGAAFVLFKGLRRGQSHE